MKKTDIIILGFGIGGYTAYKKLISLRKKSLQKYQITVLDKNNHFTFTPMLHEVASGSIQGKHCTIPAREVVKINSGDAFQQTEVVKIDPNKNIIHTSGGKFSYKYCLFSLGSESNYFNIPGAKENTLGVRTMEEAQKIHENLLDKLENDLKEEIHLNVIGAGPTGVEIAGQFAYLAKREITKLYPLKKISVNLIEGDEIILKQTNKKVQTAALKQLKKMGVKIFLKTRVSKIEEKKIFTATGKVLKGDINIWTAGLKGMASKIITPEYCLHNSLKVNEFLQQENFENLFVIGDSAFCLNEKTEKPYPQLGEIAHHQGLTVAKNIFSKINNKPLEKFTYQSKGFLIPIGDWFAIVQIYNFTISGRFAWWLRRTAYLAFMPGFLHKLKIIFDWTMRALGASNTANLPK